MGTWYADQTRIHNFITPRLAPLPDLAGRQPELQQRLRAAHSAAEGRFQAKAGLEELARLYQVNGFSAEAETSYETLTALEPNNPRWAHRLAALRASYGDIDLALPLWKQVVLLAPDYLPAQLSLAEAYLKTTRTDDADSLYRQVLSKDPNQASAYLGRARCELARQHNEQARSLLEQAVTLQPMLSTAWALLASLYDQMKEPSLAQAARARAQGQPPSPSDPWIDVPLEDHYDPYQIGVAASIAALAGEHEKARRGFQRASTLAPDDAMARRLLGKFLAERNELASARQELEKAVQLDPQHPDGWLYLLQTLLALGDQQAAEKALRDGLQYCPTSPGLHQELGRRQAAAGQTSAAIASFKEAKRLRPQEAAAYIDLAVLYLRIGQSEVALTELRAAHAAEPGHPMPLMALARHAIESKDEPAARHWIRQLKALGSAQPGEVNDLTRYYEIQFARAP
ncbi:MAG TPA: tetratricopeptide repeat protein [Opitutaceae bacterium]|nr:tetratricopeptide repeat protein [Opitutaceae bacterium]